MPSNIIVGIAITLFLAAIGIFFGLIARQKNKHARIQVLMFFAVMIWATWLGVFSH